MNLVAVPNQTLSIAAPRLERISTPPARGVSYCDSNFSFSDFQRITELLKAQYGDKYPDPDWMRPELIRAQVNVGTIKLCAARDAQGKIIAAAAATKEPDGLVKIGQLIVDPESRGLGLGRKVACGAIALGREFQGHALVAICFTAHNNSQNIFYDEGFRPAGLALGSRGNLFGVERESVVVMALITNPEITRQRTYAVPKWLHETLGAAYENLNCSRTLSLPSDSLAAKTGLSVQPEVNAKRLLTTHGIHIALNGTTDPESLTTIERNYGKLGAVYAMASVSLSSPNAPQQLEMLAQSGYVFSSVQPLSDGDEVRMQKRLDGERFPKPDVAHSESRNLLNLITSLH